LEDISSVPFAASGCGSSSPKGDSSYSFEFNEMARTLLLLARCGAQGPPQKLLSGTSQEMPAKMVGRARARVTFFMNKFRRLGFSGYGGNQRGLEINKSLLNVALHDSSALASCNSQ
jgi:CRP/FNR family transcriptional regulator, cyclic AMP receptor protein